MNNRFVRLLSSMPIVLLALYYLPFIGVCLLILRYFVVSNRKRTSTPVILIVIGILILLPKISYAVLEMLKLDINTIPYLNEIINMELYNTKFMDYSEFLITIGIIDFIITYALKRFSNRISREIRKTQKAGYEISKKNDMEIKMKRERARNTDFVKCKHCGGDNILTEKVGSCKYCRRKIVNKNYKDM